MLFGGRSGGQAASGGRQRVQPVQGAPDEPWIMREGRWVPNPNWVNPHPNLEYWAAFGPPAVGLLGALGTPSVYGLARADLIRKGETVIPNQLVHGSGTPGVTIAPAVKGGGPNLPFHYHIHRYNWYKPHLWFRKTPIARGKTSP